ncbi:MAG TPA: ComEC/Rec2 family competence protein [Acidimicrobiales bacterium]|nr:ComEC/Rec2 family competence protein [Acidimicrobiales bacterium]
MSDAWAVVLAVVAMAGAIAGSDGHVVAVPLVVGAVLAPVALAARRPAVLCLGVALLAVALGQRSVAGLVPPPTGPVQGEVTLVGDPEPDGRGGVAVDVRLDGHRLRAVAHAAPAAALDDRLTGERVTLIGTVAPPGRYERLVRHRHLVGRLEVDTVVGWRPGHGVTGVANALRRTLAAGAADLPARQRSLLAGLTLGDDRDQPADMADAFEAAGLTHLLAVSGQNVTFALMAASPLLGRLRFGPRLAATLGVLAGFALVTRFEPSVLRATAMAAVAVAGTTLGRPTSSLRALALGVAGMVLVDPLLASSLGFQLSVLGAGGIVVGARRLAEALPGPAWLRAPLSVTLAAQIAVSPLLVATFGAVPLASLPANLLAEPAAGPIMVWGLTGGLAAGLVGGPVAAVLHAPTRLLLAWLEAVALAAARWPLGDVRAPELHVLLGGAALLAAAHALRRGARAAWEEGAGPRDPNAEGRADAAAPAPPGPWAVVAPAHRPPAGRDGRMRVGRADWVSRGARVLHVCGWTVLSAACVAAVMAHPMVRPGPIGAGMGAEAWHAGDATVLVVDGRAHDDVVLGRLRDAGVRRVDLVVLRTGSPATAEVAATLRRRWPAIVVLVPPVVREAGRSGRGPPAGPMATVTGASVPPEGGALDIGGLRLTVDGVTADRLEVSVEVRPEGDARRRG